MPQAKSLIVKPVRASLVFPMSTEPTLSERQCRLVDGWQVHEFASLPSTNPVAGALPIWHAVRADVQTDGRGRTGRVWVSDTGGLWLSCVLPAPGPRKKWSILPLGAGWAIIEALQPLGGINLRLRWPNDVLLDRKKLAGILVEQFRPETAVIGVGINIANQPATLDPSLRDRTIAVNQLAGHPVAQETVTQLVLGAFRRLQSMIAEDRFPEIVADINRRWGKPRPVELLLNRQSAPLSGHFQSVDPEGRLAFVDATGRSLILDASEVALLREL